MVKKSFLLIVPARERRKNGKFSPFPSGNGDKKEFVEHSRPEKGKRATRFCITVRHQEKNGGKASVAHFPTDANGFDPSHFPDRRRLWTQLSLLRTGEKCLN